MNPFLRRKTENANAGVVNSTQLPPAMPVQPSPFVPTAPPVASFVPTQNAIPAPPPTVSPISAPPVGTLPTELSTSPITPGGSHVNRHGVTASALYRQAQPQQVSPVNTPAASVTEPAYQSTPTFGNPSEPVYTPAPIYQQPQSSVLPPEQRVSGNSIPHPTAYFEAPTQVATDDFGRLLPLAGDPMIVIEGNNSSPAFMRPSSSVLAEERSMMNTILSGKDPSFSTGLGIVLTPFAKNAEIPSASCPHGIPRCSNCRGYINCFTEFTDYGNSFICNLCGTKNEVPEYYRSPLNQQGKPVDMNDKTELQQGSYEVVVEPSTFNMKTPQTPVFVFLLDISVNAINSGLLQTAIQSIRASLSILAEKKNNTRVGFVTMDTRTKFVTHVQDKVKEIICADYEQSFGCISCDQWLTPVTNETLPILQKELDYIQSFANAASTATHCVLMATIKAVAYILQSCGGRMVVVQSNASYGEGSSQVHEGLKIYGTTEEVNLYNRAIDSEFLTEISSICSSSSISIDLIVSSVAQTFFSLNVLESVISAIGGTIFYKPTLFGAYRDQTLAEIHAYIQVLVLNETYRSFSARLRLSEGLSVVGYYGGLTAGDGSCYCSSCVTSDNSVVAEIEMDRYIKGPYAYAQYAVLYYNDNCQCCIRVFNYRFRVSTDYMTVYHGLDFSAYFLLLVRAAVAMIESDGVYKTRQKVTEVIANVLATYRNSCCLSSPKSQLCLPESLSLLPLYLNSLLKSSLLAMSPMNAVARIEDIYPRADERVYAKWLCYNCTLERVLDFIYPHFYQLKEEENNWGIENEEFISLPSRLPLTGAALSHDGLFVLTGRDSICLIVGKTLSPELCQRLFNTSTIVNTVHAASLSLVDNEDPLNNRIHTLLYTLREMYGEYLQVRIVLRGEKEMNEVSRNFRDDRLGNDPSLSEFVCTFFKQVLEKYKLCVC